MSKPYQLHVNGQTLDVPDPVPGESLMTVLRERLGLRGTKTACSEGECGSCSVLVDGELMCSCLVMAAAVTDRAITTVEGLGDDGISDIQRAFV
ncbi:MAG: (2Fe-2S)-binding protein, partial [Gammaproteobacteria bacterium]|nr:(2Fe-2S)-binding protein [Gammaproteobacteria bacterium]